MMKTSSAVSLAKPMNAKALAANHASGRRRPIGPILKSAKRTQLPPWLYPPSRPPGSEQESSRQVSRRMIPSTSP